MSTIIFKRKPRIIGWYSVAGKKESEGPLGETFSRVVKDEYFGEKTHEGAERKFFITAIQGAIQSAGVQPDIVFAGDLLNQIVIVGRLTGNPEVVKSEEGKERSQITLAVPRSYKNADGEYDTDFVDCVLWGGVAENTAEYCKKGDIVGVKGRIQTNNYETEDGEKRKSTQIVAEKVTFLSSKKEKEDDIEKSDDELDM